MTSECNRLTIEVTIITASFGLSFYASVVPSLPSEIATCPNCDGALSAEEVQSAPLRCPHCNELLLAKFPQWYERLRLATCLIAGIVLSLWLHPDWGSFVIFVVGFYWLGAFAVWHVVVRPFMRPKQISLLSQRPLIQTLGIGLIQRRKQP